MDYLVFLTLILVPYLADSIYHKNVKDVSLKDAIIWTLIYVGSALLFFGYLFFWNQEKSILFLTGFVLEKVLSVDNLIVIGSIFVYFGIPHNHQHKVLHYGILGAAAFRLLFIFCGITLFKTLGQVIEVFFGLLILWTAYKMLSGAGESEEIDHENRWYIKYTKKILPISSFPSGNFLVKENGLKATPLLLCLIAVEFTDILFAFDSVPTIIAVSQDTLVVYSAIMFAILGLRNLYFVLEALKKYLYYLQTAVSVVLFYIGFKLLSQGLLHYKIDPFISLGVVMGILVLGVVASLLKKD